MRSARGRAALLLVTLAVLAVVIGTVSSGLSSPLLGLALSSPKPLRAATSAAPVPGLLLVRVSMYGAGGVSPSFGLSEETPVANATVSVGSGVPGSPSLLMSTNSSGEAEVKLLPGNYALEVSNTEFSAFKDVSVVGYGTTIATVTVNKSETKPVFSDMSDADGSGYVGPWQQISLAVNSSSAKLILSSDDFFLDPAYSNQSATSAVAAAIVSAPADPSASGLLWFIVRPASFIPVTGLSSLSIATYTASMKVIILEP
jgi:hypothetical protein